QIFTEPTLSDSDFQQILDVKGLRCPMPMLRTKKALAKMQPGEKLLVQATDPHALRDLSQFGIRPATSSFPLLKRTALLI
ncbi:sulfurtransferase TusA family protein, partial [Parasutterella excrementihominis]|uniref:sulfurtransferase TusA family protein n=1 Tax=Parasutterella excrementihominis TaxID=487175 RepID=UPI003F736B25